MNIYLLEVAQASTVFLDNDKGIQGLTQRLSTLRTQGYNSQSIAVYWAVKHFISCSHKRHMLQFQCNVNSSVHYCAHLLVPLVRKT